MNKYTESSWAIGTSYANWQMSLEDYDVGEVNTPYGIISVYMQGCDDYQQITRLDFVVDGICYTRTWDRRYSRKYVVTLAKRFAAEITS